MDDVFVERLVARKLSGLDRLKKLGIVIAIIAVAVISFSIQAISALAPVLIVGACWGGWILMGRTNVEYEYSLSNGELTIDAIYGQSKRKTLVSVVLRENLEIMAPAKSEHKSELTRTVQKEYDVASQKDAPNAWFMMIKGKEGLVRVLFEPDERLINSMRKCAPHKVKVPA